MRNRGEGIFSISQLPITSLKLPSISPLIISFSKNLDEKEYSFRVLLNSNTGFHDLSACKQEN